MPHPRRRNFFCAIGFAVIIALACFAAGLQYFAHEIRRGAAVQSNRGGDNSAVVVITGSRGRIEAGLMLMLGGEDAPRRMLISGIGGGLGLDDILRIAALTAGEQKNIAPVLFCCVDLGRAAQDTRGNADEALAWARAHGLTDIILVTSDFHMPRALLAFRRAIENDDGEKFSLHPHAVATEGLGLDDNGRSMWWRSFARITTLAREYGKYLAALLY